MINNIKISYILSFFFNSWFWLGIWILYYLRFTSYSGIGLIESFAIISSTLTEIPTGAIADLLGKRKTLILSFLIGSIGELIMGFAPSFIFLFISVIIVALSHSLYSGTFEALIYDSLKEVNQEKNYDKIISNISSISLIASALASILGGFIYSLRPNIPYLLVSLFYFLGLLATLFLKEPSIDTEKFSLKNYFLQNKQGFFQLFKNKYIKNQSIFLIATGIFAVVSYEILNDSLAIEFGFNSQELGILFALTFLTSALVSQLTPLFTKKFGNLNSVFILNLIIALIYLLVPFINLYLGGLIIIILVALFTILKNINSIIVNQNTDSKNRATTISTLNMIKQVPYMFLAYFIGKAIDITGVRNIAIIYALLLLSFNFIFKVNNIDSKIAKIKTTSQIQ